MYFLDNLKNSFDFFLRNHITFSRKNYSEKNIDLNKIVFTDKQNKIFDYLRMNYNFNLLENTSNKNFFLNLYLLSVFDMSLSKETNKPISVLDIGSKNWAYVKSEYAFFKSFAKGLTLNGIELDAYRMYSNFYNRHEIAKFYIKDLKDTNYIIGDLMEHSQKYDYIIWILPFITEYPLVKWGLPLKYFKPYEMLIQAYNLLNPGGELLIINQGEEEYSIQQELISKMNTERIYLPLGEIEDNFSLFKNKRYCSKLIKTI